MMLNNFSGMFSLQRPFMSKPWSTLSNALSQSNNNMNEFVSMSFLNVLYPSHDEKGIGGAVFCSEAMLCFPYILPYFRCQPGLDSRKLNLAQ